MLWAGGQTHSYVIFLKTIFYIRNRAVKWFSRDHISFASGRQKSIRMSCFIVTDHFLTTFYYVEKRNGILRKNRERGLKNLTYPYMGGMGVSKISKFTLN